MTNKFPRAKAYTDRHGRTRWRVFARGKYHQLGAEWGSPEFAEKYAEATGQRRTKAPTGRTMSDLIASYYGSPAYRDLAPSTKRHYRWTIEAFREEHGDKRVATLERKHVVQILGKLVDRPAAANDLRARLCTLLDHAIDIGWVEDNVARKAKRHGYTRKPIYTWTEADVARFLAVHPHGTVARRAMTIMLWTGASLVDVVKFGPWNVSDGCLEYRRQKTQRRGSLLLRIPLAAELAAELAPLPTDRTFLATVRGTQRSERSLGWQMRQWCDEANLPACSSHGLRKCIARRLAEAGCTPHEIAAVTGHKTLAEVERYTRDADREGLASSAMAKLTGPNHEQKVVNLTERFATNDRNLLQPKGKK